MTYCPVSRRVNRTLSRKRPWLAALLGVLATGLGHLYLRRWRRAAGWLAALLAVSYLFVDPTAVQAASVGGGGDVDLVALAPVLAVGSLSALDAYLLARARNALAGAAAASEDGLARCPNCRGEVDSDLDFCHWCAAELPDVDPVTAADVAGSDDDDDDDWREQS
jgi:hypothetical protein